MNVLISVPTFPLSGMRYLPLVWACLKSYHDHKGKYPEKINWLPPLKNSVDIENFLKSNVKVDVLGLSNYMWNSKINTYLTEEIKKRNPNCFVICGGPEFDTTNKKNFGKLIDLYVPIEGEATFSALLDRFVKNQDWRDVGGIVYRGKDKVIKTPPLPWIRDWEYSPLLDHKEYMSEVVEENASLGLKTLLQFETTRGCPYSCTYCDWGGGIHTKIRQRPVDILQKEIEWSGQNKIWKYFITDANFGILKRDIEVAKIIVDTKKEYGYPRGVLYQTAKNQTEQIVEIADIFYKGTVSSGHMMSMQSTDETVLANVKRSNLPAERQKKIAEMLHERGVPVKSQLIIGLPGDTIKTLKDSVTYLYEMGVSYEVENFILGLFPNAPAADPKYRKEMQFKTTSAYSGVICRDITTGQGYNGYDLATCNGMDHDDQSAYADTLWSETEDKSELVIGSYSFDEREWANMFSWLNIFNGLVELGIFKFL
jgi:putative methyltransferase